VIAASDPAYSVLARYKEQLRYVHRFGGDAYTRLRPTATGGVHVEVKKADGAKCVSAAGIIDPRRRSIKGISDRVRRAARAAAERA